MSVEQYNEAMLAATRARDATVKALNEWRTAEILKEDQRYAAELLIRPKYAHASAKDTHQGNLSRLDYAYEDRLQALNRECKSAEFVAYRQFVGEICALYETPK